MGCAGSNTNGVGNGVASRSGNTSSSCITRELVTKKIGKLKDDDDIRCMRYCYSLIPRSKQGDKGVPKLKDVLLNIYGKEEIKKLGDRNAEKERTISIAMGPDGVPVCQIPEGLRGTVKNQSTGEKETKSYWTTEEDHFDGHRAKTPDKKCSCICNRCQLVNVEGAILEMKCEPAISFRHISAAKTRLANQYALTREVDIKTLNSCNTFIEKTDTKVLENATFIVSCGDEVTVVLHAGDGSNVFEFTLNEKGKPIKKEINNIVDGSYRQGACGAPHMQNTKEFGYYVISETDVDRLVSDFKKWRLISKDDERLLLYVKRVFEKEGTEDLKAACPDIKSNVHLTVRCSKFNVVLKAGKCYNICTVYMERSKPKYKCKRLSGWRRVVENISMYKFDKVLKDVRLGPFRLDLSDEITGGGADEAFVDEDDDGFNDDDHDDDFGDDGGDELS